MDFIEWIDVNNAVTDIFSGLIVSFITAVVVAIFVKKYVSQITFSRKMKALGFQSATVDKVSRYERNKLFKEAKEIKMIRVSGLHFFIDNEKLIKDSLNDGLTMKFLCSNPYSTFLEDIENMEHHHKDKDGNYIRSKNKKIKDEVLKIHEMYKDTTLQIKFYNTEYRIPFTLGYFKDDTIKAWLTVTLPPYISTKNNFILRGFKDLKNTKDDDENFIDMMEVHFDNVWEHGSYNYDEIMVNENNSVILNNYKKWKEQNEIAKNNMKVPSKKSSLLIEVAAQHPLINGKFPNDEFKARLDASLNIYKDKINDYAKISFYIPGSRHTYEGIEDQVSLSKAGKTYLMKQGISENKIYSDEANNKYTDNQGVYNSIDECMVASKIYNDNHFSDMYCVCSPAQLHRKALAYIKFGIIPKMYSVPLESLYHDYVEEIYKYIPSLINYSDNINDKLRLSRIPKKTS